MAIDFEAGSSQFLELPRPNTLARNRAAMTCVLWFKPESNVNSNFLGDSTNNGGVPTSNTRFLFKSTTAPANGLELAGRAPDGGGLVSGASGGGELSNGTWAHLAGVVNYAGDIGRIYVNGALDSSPALAFANAATDNTDSASGAVGAEEDSSSGFQDGVIADMLLYEREITLAEVQTIRATKGACIPYFECIARWHMKELGLGVTVGAGATVRDCVGTNVTDLTRGGTPVYTDGPVRFRRQIG